MRVCVEGRERREGDTDREEQRRRRRGGGEREERGRKEGRDI